MLVTLVFYLSDPFTPKDWLVLLAIAIDIVLEVSGALALFGLLV